MSSGPADPPRPDAAGGADHADHADHADYDEPMLVDRMRDGDEAAFEQLVRRETPRLLAVARRLLRDEAEAQDAVQEGFLAAFRSLAGFREGSRLSTWLHRIVVNASLMKLRSRRRRPEESIDELLPRFQEDGHQVDPPRRWVVPAQEELERREVQAHVRQTIDRLPETFRTVLLLRDIEGLSTDEAAGMLDITPNAVKVRLHRARQALRTLLDPRLREGV